MAETALLINPRRRWWKVRGVEYFTTHASPFPPNDRHLAILDAVVERCGCGQCVRRQLALWGFTTLYE